MAFDSLRRRLSYLRLAFDRQLALPVYLVLFVNGVCHAKCLHCFLPSLQDRQAANSKLSLSEIEKLSHHFGPAIYAVLLTGGEPFLREDLGDILDVLSRTRQLCVIKVATSGFFTDQVVTTWERVLAQRRDKYYGVTISFDGPRKVHDYIRGVPGSFSRAVTTLNQLKRLEQIYKNFEVDVHITVSRFNQDHLDELYDELRGTMHVGNVICSVIRGEPRDPRAKDLDLSKYFSFSERLADDLSSGALAGHLRFSSSSILNAVNIVQRKRIERMLKCRKCISPCNAARLSAVVGSDGQVYACELLSDALGDLRKSDYDLVRIWNSPSAQAIRQRLVATGCFCTYENANLLNVLFSPRYYPNVAVRAAWMSACRMLHRCKEPPADPASVATGVPISGIDARAGISDSFPCLP